MPTQRITLLKFSGVAGEEILQRFTAWSVARTPGEEEPNGWGEEQWPDDVRRAADALADLLKAHAMQPPCLWACEWLDSWSMFDLFHRWLVPPKPQRPLVVYGDRYELHAYALPDRGRLKRRLAKAGKQQFPEYDWLITCLREAADAYAKVVDRAALVLIRQVLGGSLCDTELDEQLAKLPAWLGVG